MAPLTDPRREVMVLRLVLLMLIAGAVALDMWRTRSSRQQAQVARRMLAVWAGASIAFVIFLWFNHARAPTQLEITEEMLLQHVARAARGLPVYPAPTPEYVALAYNPLFYYLAVPFTWIFGVTLEAGRVAAIVGMAGSGLLIYAAIRASTGSRWWGLIGLGLFATAYRTMDTLLDNAHADSWLLCCALGGTYLIDRASTNRQRMLGVVVLVLAFWFKQHGALFAIGGVLYLTWRFGWRRSLPYWAAAIILGPLVYAAAGSWPFGVDYHYFTWTVPRGWSRLNLETVLRVVRFFVYHYGVLALAALALLVRAVADARKHNAPGAVRPDALRIWHVQLVVAGCTALMGSLDWGSSDNVFIPFGGFLIVVGTVGLAQLIRDRAGRWTRAIQDLAVAGAFLPLTYAPQTVIVSHTAPAAYADFVSVMRGLPGPIYAPDLGRTAGGTSLFHPGAHWVALEDMGRGPGHTDAERMRAALLLDSVMSPRGSAYIVTYGPLDGMTAPVKSLADRYTLVQDFGDRWSVLGTLPKRWVSPYTYPRFLYRYSGSSQATPPVGVAIER